MAPFELHSRMLQLIERETGNAKQDLPARIIAKVNSLAEPQIIEALYRASQAGVKIDLIVRGICCLRPGIPDLSENIRVVSIVGRFLEHSRIYCFENAGDNVLYLSSADWMPRNLVRRVEIAFPIEDPSLRKKLTQEVLPAFLDDRVKARQLQPDGTYIRLHPEKDQPASQAQLFFRQNSRNQAKRLAETTKPRSIKLTPIKAPPGQK